MASSTELLAAYVLERVDPSVDPWIGEWVLVLPSRRAALLGEYCPQLTFDPNDIVYVSTQSGRVLTHKTPPREFGGSDFEEVYSEEMGRLVYRSRYDPHIVSADRRVLAPPAVPDWVAALEVKWEEKLKQMQADAECQAARMVRRKQLEERGLDPDTGVGPWTPLQL